MPFKPLVKAVTKKQIDQLRQLGAVIPDGVAVEMEKYSATEVGTFIYKELDPGTDVIKAGLETDTSTCWSSTTTGILTSFYTSSTEVATSASNYYYNVYPDATSAVSGTNVQFAIAYGNYTGAGGVTGSAAGYTGNQSSSITPTKTIYSQYKSLLLLPTDSQFSFGSSGTPDDIIVINFNRSSYKEKLDPGNWELHLSGTLCTMKLIDSSGESEPPTISQSGRVYTIVSGTIATGTSSANSTVFGLAYPDVGILILNATAVSHSCSIGTSTASYVAHSNSNNNKIYNAIVGGAHFEARNVEKVNSTYYFVRAGNSEFNYSNNPTFVTGSLGLIRYGLFQSTPATYITSVGLYNDSNELLAVAKLSSPLLKSFTRECLIRIKLSY